MTPHTYLRAAAVSAAGSIVLVLVSILLFSEATVYDTPMDPAEFYQLTYEEQQAWLGEHARDLSAWENLANTIRDPFFRRHFGMQLGIVFAAMFLACCAIVWWELYSRKT